MLVTKYDYDTATMTHSSNDDESSSCLREQMLQQFLIATLVFLVVAGSLAFYWFV